MSEDFLKAIDQKCGTTHHWTALSIFSSTTSGILMLLTIPLNSVIVYVLVKERRKKYRSLFYKLLLNIAIADLLTGLIADPSAVNALTKEALGVKLKLSEVYVIHVSLFFTDAVALLTLTILSIDRIIALVYPTKHYKGINNKKASICLVVSSWPFAFCLVLPYFEINFIRQLLIFSIVNIVVTVLSLIVTTITYRRKLSIKPRSSSALDTSYVQMNTVTQDKKLNQDESTISTATPTTNNTPEIKLSNKQVKNQQKATRAFILMLVVFLTTYFPTAVTMIYMNVCTKCDCLSIHIMRDISILCILSSSVFRPLNFILTLKHLKASVLEVFKKTRKEKYNLSSTSGVTAQ